MHSVVSVDALLVGVLGVALGIAVLVWVRPIFSIGMYDDRLKKSGITTPWVFAWFHIIGAAQRAAFLLGGVLAVGVGLFALALYVLGIFGLNPLHLAP